MSDDAAIATETAKLAWRVYLRRDGKTERTVDYVMSPGRQFVVHTASVSREDVFDIYNFTEIMPETREMFADFSHTEGGP